jgi:hypothetical protein
MDRVVEDVVERVVVLLLGLDHARPEPLAEDVVLAAVPLVEGTRVLAVQVAHAVGQVRQRCLDEQVVVVAKQAAGVETPAVAAADAPQDVDEDAAVPIIEEDRRVVVPFRADVVVSPGGEVAVRTAHAATVAAAEAAIGAMSEFRHATVTDPSRARHVTRPWEP